VPHDEDEGFEQFVRARSTALLRLCHVLTGDRGKAEDLLQTALANCYRHWSRVVAHGHEEGYVRTAIVNAHISSARKRRFQEILAHRLPEHDGGRDPAETISQRDLLRRLLDGLAPRTRAAVVLRHYVGLTEQETADTLHCSVGTVKALTFRGLKQLRKGMEPVLQQPPASGTTARPPLPYWEGVS
jgi:RNA polymerase sigma-70 factor (sigma-E family)